MIRPIDLQTTILSAPAPTVQRAEEAPRMAAQAAQAAFAAEATRRDEMVDPATKVLQNRVGAKHDGGGGAHQQPGRRHARTPFEQFADDAAASTEDAPHIVDFTA